VLLSALGEIRSQRGRRGQDPKSRSSRKIVVVVGWSARTKRCSNSPDCRASAAIQRLNLDGA
jgi:hypothetical protein